VKSTPQKEERKRGKKGTRVGKENKYGKNTHALTILPVVQISASTRKRKSEFDFSNIKDSLPMGENRTGREAF